MKVVHVLPAFHHLCLGMTLNLYTDGIIVKREQEMPK
jgi:hypothetical protein